MSKATPSSASPSPQPSPGGRGSRRGFLDWLDHRSGYRGIVHAALYEPIPGGSRWRYVWGSTLVMAFVTQAITGTFLWMAYSPSAQTAWESVFYIQHEMTGGWLLRGIHHFMAQAMVVLLAIHFVQVVWDGAYRAPRELNFVIGLVLMLIVLGLALTGYLLPWDQKGYWATTVGTNLASQAPVVGADLRKLTIGGSEYGHQTLTRFFALHAGVLPGLLVAFLVMHIALFRRHGLHACKPDPARNAMFWPDQILKDSVAALSVLAVVLGLTIYYGGAELTAPADPANPYDAARPEWYFLFLFQFLKWFPGELELWGAFIIPGLVTLVLFAMPWIGRFRAGHVFNVVLLFVLLGGATLLTAQALHDDYYAALYERPEDAPTEVASRFDASERFLEAKRQARREAERVVDLAMLPERIPPTGALAMMYDDAYLQGPRLFRQHCAGCHNHESEPDTDVQVGVDPVEFRANAHRLGINLVDVVNSKPTAPNLWGVGGRSWMRAFLNAEHIVDEDHFGYEGSPFVDGDMVTFVQDAVTEDMSDDERKAAEDALLKVADALWLAAGTTTKVHPNAMKELEERAEEGWELINGGLAEVVDGGMSCVDCHVFEEGEVGTAPNLYRYMSREWLIDFIRNPAAEEYYGELNDRMPAFAPHDDPQLNQLDEKSLGLIVDWLRGDWRRR
jgi:ubiquinol-cytochrome c reductase cytochrome b subunit